MLKIIFSYLTIFNILQFIYPFLIEMNIKLNILKLKGILNIKLFNKIKFTLKFRIKNGFIYIYFKKKEKKVKISEKNVSFLFFENIFKEAYFRQQYLSLGVSSNFGYKLDSCTTATTSGALEVITLGILAKIKNNKKSAHIFTKIEPKYNEDIFNVRLDQIVRISVFDILYVLIYTIIKTWGEYEKREYKSRRA